MRRVQEMQQRNGGIPQEAPKTETLVAAAAAGLAIVAAGGSSALGVAVTREPLFALIGSTAAFAALKAVEAMAPKLEGAAKKLENEEDKKSKKAKTPMPKTVNKPVGAEAAAAAVAAAAKEKEAAESALAAIKDEITSSTEQKRADADTILAAVAGEVEEDVEDEVEGSDAAALEAAEAKAAALLAAAESELAAMQATVLKAEEVEKKFKAGEMAQAANTAAAMVGDKTTAASASDEGEKKVTDMNARARRLLLNMKETREDGAAAGVKATYAEAEMVTTTTTTTETTKTAEVKKISKVNPAMTPEEIAAFWADDGDSAAGAAGTAASTSGLEEDEIMLTPPDLADIKETPFPDPRRKTNWMLVLATMFLWPLTVPFRVLRIIVRIVLWPMKYLLGGSDSA